MLVRTTYGQPMTQQKIVPGDTATGLNAATIFTKGDRAIHFTAGTTTLRVGAVVAGATSAATARIQAIVVETGTLAGSDATGWLYLTNQTGTFQSENLDIGATANVATILSDTYKILKDLQAKTCEILVEDYAVRYSRTGTTPTATSGAVKAELMQAGQNRTLTDINEIRNFKVIDAVSSEASTVQVTCYF